MIVLTFVIEDKPMPQAGENAHGCSMNSFLASHQANEAELHMVNSITGIVQEHLAIELNKYPGAKKTSVEVRRPQPPPNENTQGTGSGA